MRVLVVDDEAPARRRLVRQLGALGAEVVGEAEDGYDALAALPRTRPELLLLDVRMPGLDGIALASAHLDLPPVIFVTAHDAFALRAFELDAVDYLLKPVRPERLAAALERAERRLAPPSTALLARLSGQATRSASARIATFERGVLRLFDARAIARFWAADKYTLFRAEGDEHVTPESLTTLAERLGDHGFFRVHRSELVNLAQARALHLNASQAELELADGTRVPVSRRALTSLRESLTSG